MFSGQTSSRGDLVSTNPSNCGPGPMGIVSTYNYDYTVPFSGNNISSIDIEVGGVISTASVENGEIVVASTLISINSCLPTQPLTDAQAAALSLRVQNINLHVLNGGSYRVRARFADGAISAWTTILGSDAP